MSDWLTPKTVSESMRGSPAKQSAVNSSR